MVDFELPCQMVYLHDIQSVVLLAEDSTPVIFVAETSALAMGNIGKAGVTYSNLFHVYVHNIYNIIYIYL